jgi:hypothetical protein
MTLRLQSHSVLLAIVLSAVTLAVGGVVSRAQDSGFKLDLHADSHSTAAGVGLPAYPGATLYKEKDKDKDNDSGADVGMILGDFHFQLRVASYVTGDSPEQVLAFYRKPLSRFGEVLECNHGKPVGALTVTHSGLTCSEQHGGKVQMNGNYSSDGHELRAGTPHQFRIVGIDASHEKPTRFGLVYLELPKDSDEKSK